MKMKSFVTIVLMLAIGACTAPDKAPAGESTSNSTNNTANQVPLPSKNNPQPSKDTVKALEAGADTAENEADKTVELSFAPGASSATVEDTLSLGAIHDYLVRASAGQVLKATLTSDGPALIVVIDNDGYQPDAVQVLPSNVSEQITDRANGEAVSKGYVWKGSLPRNSVYRVRVIHSGPAVNGGAVSPYSLTVEIK